MSGNSDMMRIDIEKSDPLFLEYISALRDGDIERCEELRYEHRRKPATMAKINTLERLWLKEMALYIREVQITQRERDGWAKLAEARRKLLEKEKGAPSSQALLRQGNTMLKQAAEERARQPEIIVPRLFDGVK